jgi:hypothetical protein
VFPVRKRIHCGTWRFCFCFFARIFLTRNVLCEGIFVPMSRKVVLRSGGGCRLIQTLAVRGPADDY